MAQNLFKRLTLSFLLMSFLAACGNVRFTASSSTDGTGTTTGGGNNNPGDDGNIAGNDGGPRPGDDGAVPGATPPPPPSGARNVDYSLQIPAASKKVDFLLVIDNSASMIAVQQKMAQSMTALASKMNSLNIDWQMCLTVTTDMNKGGTASGTGTHTCTGPYCTGTYTGGTWHWGVSLPWVNGKYAVNKNDLSSNADLFKNTIPKLGAGDSGTGDERGIKAAYNHFANSKSGAHNTTGCYRAGSSVAVILLSDEDERSVAGDCSRVNTQLGDKEIPACKEYNTGALRVLEFEDKPENLISQANSVFGDTARFTFNSIISDTDQCTAQLNANASFVGADGKSYYSPHYTGTVYKKASQLTNGGIASLCSNDLQLNLFSDVVVNTLSKLNLECAPTSLSVRTGATKEAAAAATPLASSQYSVSGAVLNFNPALNENVWVNLKYSCPQ